MGSVMSRSTRENPLPSCGMTQLISARIKIAIQRTFPRMRIKVVSTSCTVSASPGRQPLSKERAANSHYCSAFLNCHLEIMTHAHRQLRQMERRGTVP